MNILGTTFDYQSVSCPFAAKIRFVRLNSNWAAMNPAFGQYVDTTFGCTDAIITAAAAAGKTIMFDFANAPAWVLDDPANFIRNIQQFALHVATRFAKLAPNADFIFGIDNEFWITLNMNPSFADAQRAVWYAAFAEAVFGIVTRPGLLPQAQINIIKGMSLEQAWSIGQTLKDTNIGLVASWATLHYRAYPFDPLTKVAYPNNSLYVMPWADQMAQLRDWFPSCKVGSDEFYCDLASLPRMVAAIERSQPDMMINALLCNANAGPNYGEFTADTWGLNNDGSFKQWALDFAEVCST